MDITRTPTFLKAALLLRCGYNVKTENEQARFIALVARFFHNAISFLLRFMLQWEKLVLVGEALWGYPTLRCVIQVEKARCTIRF